MAVERYALGLNDRVTIAGVRYRPAGREGKANLLRQVVDDAVVETALSPLTDEEYARLREAKRIRIEEGYFSHAYQLLRDRADGGDLSDLHDLTDAELRDIAWKVEWCVRFRHAWKGIAGRASRLNKTPKDISNFIAAEKHAMLQWYVDTFGTTRPPGRREAGGSRKTFDYPGATTLLGWLNMLDAGDDRPGVLRRQYHKCGNREQLDPRARGIVDKHVRAFASAARPKVTDIHLRIAADLKLLNDRLSPAERVSVSERTVRRRIAKLPPILVDLAHLGHKRALLKYAPVGNGLVSLDGLTKLERMDRVEMDDWEMDLFAVLQNKHVRATLGANAKAEERRLRKNRVAVRCTVTVAIDVVTKCVVGLQVTPFAPSAAGSKSALRSIVVDKGPLVALAGAKSDWPMTARPTEIATDGGPAFQGDFHSTLGRLDIEHRLPGPDPRQRGTIESFFRNIKRLCRLYTGQSFSNVVERGEYRSEELASLLAEDVYLHLVRFIVDDYHHTSHAGLNGKRPYQAWHQAENNLAPPPDHFKRMLSFGLAVPNRFLAADGVTYLNSQYVHPLMGKLRGLVGGKPLVIVTDPDDMGTILVRVPSEFREQFPGDGSYLPFECQDLHDLTLAEVLQENREARRFARQERLAGYPFKLNALHDLMKEAEAARRRAGVPSDVISEEQFNRLVKAVERRGLVAVSKQAAPSGPPAPAGYGPGNLGTSVAAPPGRLPPAAVTRVVPGAEELLRPSDMDDEDGL
ncbi:transposase family protein [Methylobacterium terricola]|uniref:Transposase family protein n=1 Tax=Methylobacterium terricola TaxID=2583531 RepID=A0A5C4LDS7_9HYPH|nr:transposase family protein [Methylobacterium terricola]TNC11694.1 transposase family protein [Methylobacterium terricola]